MGFTALVLSVSGESEKQKGKEGKVAIGYVGRRAAAWNQGFPSLLFLGHRDMGGT